MAHFNFEKMLSEATKLDGPLQHGPKLRYERKAMEASKRIQKGSESSLGMNDLIFKWLFKSWLFWIFAFIDLLWLTPYKTV